MNDTFNEDSFTKGDGRSDRTLTATNAVRLGEHVALPLIIALGLTTNGICLKLLRSPVLKKTYIHKYITLMVCLDIVNFVFHIPKIFGHCPLSNYGFAVYMTKVNWVIILFLRTISIYILVFISYDRFLAIWFTNKFQDTVDSDPFKIRMTVLVIWCLISTIPAISMGQVNEHNGSGGIEWISIPALKVKPSNTWEEFYGVYSGTFLVGLPISVIVGLSLGLVLGIVLNKIRDFDQERRRTQILKTVAVLALNISFGFLFVPYSALLLHYDKPEDKCYKSAAEETLLFGLYILILLWSAFNGLLYVLLNEAYMQELKNMIRSSRLTRMCFGSDSDKNQAVSYFTFNDSSKANEDNVEENKDNTKEELPKDNYIKDEPDSTINSPDITHNQTASDATNAEKRTPGKDSDNEEEHEITKQSNNTSPDNTNEGFEPDKEDLEKENCIKATTSTVNYSTFSGPDKDDDRHLILHFNNDKKKPIEKDNVFEDKPQNTKIPSNESPNHSSSDEVDPEMEIVDRDDCIRDEPESSDFSPGQSPNDSEKVPLGKDKEIDDNDEEETKTSEDISPTHSTSENIEPAIKRGSFQEYDVKKAKGNLEDAAKLYKSTASISFGK